jgi:urease accessory protein
VLARTSTHDAIFAGNRADSRIALAVGAAPDGRGSRRTRVHEAGALRLRFPNGEAQGALEAVMVNTAGGMAGGDRLTLDIALGAGAQLCVTTAAAEKIYRSLGPNSEIGITLKVDAGAALAWLPQETIMFDGARVKRTIHVELKRGGTLLLAEAVVFGRAAMGEAVRSGSFFDRWRVRVDGALVFAETVRLDGDIAQHLTRRAIAGGGIAVASVLKVPGDDAAVAGVRAAAQSSAGEVGASAWNGLALTRLVAADGAALRRDLIGVLTALAGMPLPRLWLN